MSNNITLCLSTLKTYEKRKDSCKTLRESKQQNFELSTRSQNSKTEVLKRRFCTSLHEPFMFYQRLQSISIRFTEDSSRKSRRACHIFSRVEKHRHARGPEASTREERDVDGNACVHLRTRKDLENAYFVPRTLNHVDWTLNY